MEKKIFEEIISKLKKGVMLSEFLVVCILLLLGIKLNKYRGDFFLSILKKKYSFLNKCLEWKLSISNSNP